MVGPRGGRFLMSEVLLYGAYKSLVLASRQKSLKRFTLFPLRSEAVQGYLAHKKLPSPPWTTVGP